jgi:hypothetical protein
MSRRRAAPRGQAGYTLLELLLVVALSLLIMAPLTTWMILVMREQPAQRDGMLATAWAEVLRGYFPEDVAVAGAADDYRGAQPEGGMWDTWRQDCAGGAAQDGRRLVVLLSQAAQPVKILYSVVQEPGGIASLWRTECVAATGVLVSERRVLDEVVDDPARTTATCTSAALANGDPDAPCRQIRLVVARSNDRSIELSATRRTDARSLEVDTGGNFLPVAKIVVSSQEWLGAGSHATRVALDSTGSFDPDGAPDGSDLTYRWEVPTGPVGSGAPVDSSLTGPSAEVVLPSAGDYWIRLTVTDTSGASNTTYRKVSVVNRTPVIAMSSPLTARAEVDTLTLDASASNDPDGSIVSWNWVLSSVSDPGQQAAFTSPVATFAVPIWAVGGLVVELTVVDDSGASAVATSYVEVLDPLAPDPDPGGDPDPDPEPVPGAPVVSAVVTPAGGTTMTLDGSGSTGTNLTSWSWQLGLLAGTASGPTVTVAYPGPGTYTVRLTVTDDQGRSGRWTGEVQVPGTVPAPTNLRTQGSTLLWDAVPGTRRYLVDFESTSNGCARSLLNQVVAPTEAPGKVIPSTLCVGVGSRTNARVGTETTAGGPIAWSAWIDITAAVPG